MSDEIRKIWMPLTKSDNGNFRAILSDNSIDRDDEFMGKELILNWASNKSLPAMINHDYTMENWVGKWDNFETYENEGKCGLSAEPKFFKTNPKAVQIEKQINEALDMGMSAGVSIGARPLKFEDVEVSKGCKKRKWVEAELLEASFVPIPSNKNAGYGYRSYEAIAKSFDINKENSKEDKMSEEETKKDDAVTEAPKEGEVAEPTEKPVEESKEEKSEVAELKKMVAEQNKMLKNIMDKQPKKAVINHVSETMPEETTKDYFGTIQPTLANLIAARKGFEVPERFRK